MHLAVFILIVSISAVSAIIHSIGLCLLCSLDRYGQLAVLHKYLISLSICEIAFNIFEIAKRTSELFIGVRGGDLALANDLHEYLTLISFTSVTMVLYLLMSYITIDRLMSNILCKLYPLYWNCSKVNLLVGCTWFICISTSCGFTILQSHAHTEFSNILMKYCSPTLDVTFLVLCTVTFFYACIKKSKMVPTSEINTPHNSRRGSAVAEKRKSTVSRIFDSRSNFDLRKARGSFEVQMKGLLLVLLKSNANISGHLIVIFLILMVIPNTTEVFLRVFHVYEKDENLAVVFSLLYTSMTLCHGIAYLVFHPPTKRQFRRLFKVKQSEYSLENPLIVGHLITATSAVTINARR